MYLSILGYVQLASGLSENIKATLEITSVPTPAKDMTAMLQRNIRPVVGAAFGVNLLVVLNCQVKPQGDENATE
jgi:hypothetical protein